jgi:hypothetical protein
MATIKSIVNDAVSAASSNLQFVGEVPSGYRYREILSGAEFDSPNIIEGAKGNPPENGGSSEKKGETILSEVTESNNGLYIGQEEQTSRIYYVNPTISGTGDNKKIENRGTPEDAGKAVRSKFNRWSLFKTNNIKGVGKNDKSSLQDKMSKALNGPDSADNVIINPTANNIVNYVKSIVKEDEKDKASFHYDLADFIQCEHYGAISNEYLITLRRFPYPVKDDIMTPEIFGSDGKPISAQQPDIARALTYLSPALGNDLKEILKFKVGFNWKDVESKIQEITQSSGKRGAIGAAIDGSPLLSAIESASAGRSAADAQLIRDKGAGWDPTSETYPNKVFGPYNVIDKILTRDRGMIFEQDFSLTFYYDIRGYGNTSPKAAFMDTMSNLLALTYNNAPFWGGATRYLGSGSVGKPFGDFNKLASGDYKGYFEGLGKQFSSGFSNISKDLDFSNGFGGFFDSLGDSKIFDNVIGGGLMKLLNGPQGATIVNSFISGDPTGNWHLTVGNPMNPMLVAGNLALQDAQFEFEGPLGYEGFPTKLKVTITLKPGRARDKGEIESMFNAGRGRMYLQSDAYNPGSEETIATPYGKQRVPNDMERRISDLTNG